MDRRVTLSGMNAPEKLFHTLLGLGENWQITELEFNKDSSEVRLRITERPGLFLTQLWPDDQGLGCDRSHNAAS